MLALKSVGVGFDAHTLFVDDISLDLSEGHALLVCGAGGSGKSTLLAAASGVIPRLVKPAHFSGEVALDGAPLRTLSNAALFSQIGLVFQNLDDQLWNLSLEDLIAFPLENRGRPRREVRDQVAALIASFGLERLRGRQVLTMSGGERRMAALAAAMSGEPRVLILDEPTTGLDPEARSRLVAILRSIRQGTPHPPILLAADQDGSSLAPAMEQVSFLRGGSASPPLPMPAALGLSAAWLEAGVLSPGQVHNRRHPSSLGKGLLEVSGLRTRLRRSDGRAVIENLDLTLHAGEVVAVIGPNGAGKTTLFQTILGLIRQERGRIIIEGHDAGTWTPGRRARAIGYLPQNMRRVLFNMTVLDEVAFAIAGDTRRIADPGVRAGAESCLSRFGLAQLGSSNPFALSSRQQGILGLACLDGAQCPVSILDEPLLGRDVAGRAMLDRYLAEVTTRGRAALLITHDMDLVDEVADRVIMMREGQVAFEGPTAACWPSMAFRSLGWDSPRIIADMMA